MRNFQWTNRYPLAIIDPAPVNETVYPTSFQSAAPSTSKEMLPPPSVAVVTPNRPADNVDEGMPVEDRRVKTPVHERGEPSKQVRRAFVVVL